MKNLMNILINGTFIIAALCHISAFIMFATMQSSESVMSVIYLTAIIGSIAALIFIISSICEVVSNKSLHTSEKIIWSLGLVLTGIFTGIIYVVMRGKMIPDEKR